MICGSGTPRREFQHVDDMAEAALFVLDLPQKDCQAKTEPMLSHINVGTGKDISIRELAELIAEVTGFKGRISTDPSRPDATQRKTMDISMLSAMGWQARIDLGKGGAAPYRWYLEHEEEVGAWSTPSGVRDYQ